MHWVLILAQIKAIATIRLYLDALAYLTSLLAFIHIRSMNFFLFIFSATLIVSQLLVSLYSSINIYRFIILFLMLIFASLVLKLPRTYKISKFISHSVIISVLFLLLEIFLIQYASIHVDYAKYFGESIPRLTGTIGEPNYFGYFSLLMFILLQRKGSVTGFILLCMIFISGSRGAMLSIILWPLLSILNLLPLRTVILNIICLITALSPWLVYGLLQSLDYDFLVLLNALSSNRLEIWDQLLGTVLDYPFGVGYFKSTEFVGVYESPFSLRSTGMQPHNTWFQILAEFGIVSYAVSVSLFMAISIKLTGQRKSYFIMAVAPLQFLHIIGSFLMVLLFFVFKNLVDQEKLSRTRVSN